MNLGLWITALVFLVYFALVYTASKTGWLERHNMSLAMGIIIMWSVQLHPMFMPFIVARCGWCGGIPRSCRGSPG